MSNALRPLCLYPYPLEPDDMARVKAAKAALAVDFQVMARPAVPGGDERVLALRERPSFACDHALVADPAGPGLSAALAWAMGAPDARATTMAQHLSMMLGAPVTEIPWSDADDLEATTGVRFA